MKELSSENVNLKRLYEEETSSTEPVLIIISPGTDPSQELEDLAKTSIGLDRYHQVLYGSVIGLLCIDRVCSVMPYS